MIIAVRHRPKSSQLARLSPISLFGLTNGCEEATLMETPKAHPTGKFAVVVYIGFQVCCPTKFCACIHYANKMAHNVTNVTVCSSIGTVLFQGYKVLLSCC